MSHTLEVPDDLYRKIANYAAEAAQEPDALMLAWVAEAAKRLSDSAPTATGATFDERALLAGDPMTMLAGIIDSHAPGWADDHDAYFGSDEYVGDEHA